jgi:hypothetical protein
MVACEGRPGQHEGTLHPIFLLRQMSHSQDGPQKEDFRCHPWHYTYFCRARQSQSKRAGRNRFDLIPILLHCTGIKISAVVCTALKKQLQKSRNSWLFPVTPRIDRANTTSIKSKPNFVARIITNDWKYKYLSYIYCLYAEGNINRVIWALANLYQRFSQQVPHPL